MSSYVKVVVFVGTRADLGPLTPLLTAMAAARDLDLHLFTGVGYTADALADALPGPFSPREWRARIHELDQPIGNMTVEAMLQSGPRIGAAAARELAHVQPDGLVVRGDRWELLYAVPPAFLAGVPIVHLHGGEVTEGALDERAP